MCGCFHRVTAKRGLYTLQNVQLGYRACVISLSSRGPRIWWQRTYACQENQALLDAESRATDEECVAASFTISLWVLLRWPGQ